MIKRIAIYPLSYLKEFYDDCELMPYDKPFKKIIENTQVKVNSWRYLLFLKKGFKCVKCNQEASFLALETCLNKKAIQNYEKLLSENKILAHFNVYGINKNGDEILFTKDHIWPEALRGRNRLDNFQTYCLNCNSNKKNIPDISLEEAIERDLIKPDSNFDKIREKLNKEY